jgi:hypothetical protein
VIRAATLLIVLSLTGTPTATSLCIAWCGAQTSPGSTGAGCHQAMTTGGASRLVTKEHGCGELLQGAPFVREDPQRAASGSASDHVVVAAQHHFHYAEAAGEPESLTGGQPPALRQSHPTVLRV